MSDEVISTAQGISVVEEIDQETTDTYAKAREVAEQQIAKEQAVHAELDALESDVLGIWDDYLEIPYGRLTLRIRSDLPSRMHNKIGELIGSAEDDGDELVNPFADVLVIISMGLYNEDVLIQETNATFWNNPDNWSIVKVQSTIRAYMMNYKKEMDKTTSFLDA